MIIHLAFIILIIIIYINHCRGYNPICPSISLRQLIKKRTFKTGDLLFFKRFDSLVPYMFGIRFSHVGIIYIDPIKKNKPQILEINFLWDKDHITRSHSEQINLSDLEYRLTAYKGLIYYKELKNEINKKICEKFRKFIKFAKKNMFYEIRSGFMILARKYLNDPFHYGTNCVELTMLSLIKLNILSNDEFKNKKLNYFKYLLNLKKTKNNEYKDLIKIIIFDY